MSGARLHLPVDPLLQQLVAFSLACQPLLLLRAQLDPTRSPLCLSLSPSLYRSSLPQFAKTLVAISNELLGSQNTQLKRALSISSLTWQLVSLTTCCHFSAYARKRVITAAAAALVITQTHTHTQTTTRTGRCAARGVALEYKD